MQASLSTPHFRALAARIDPSTLAEVQQLNPTEEELSEALFWLDGDTHEPLPHPSRARTMALFAVLSDALDEGDLDDASIDDGSEDAETESY